jgi:hypothetical protein
MMAQNAPAVMTFENLIDIDIKESSAPVQIQSNNQTDIIDLLDLNINQNNEI